MTDRQKIQRLAIFPNFSECYNKSGEFGKIGRAGGKTSNRKGWNLWVSQIPNAPGVSRTVTGLVFMILDLHLRVLHLTKKLVWFSDLENHFVFQFSDDGAPETSQMNVNREFNNVELGRESLKC